MGMSPYHNKITLMISWCVLSQAK